MKTGLKNKRQYAERGGVNSHPLWLDFDILGAQYWNEFRSEGGTCI